jgi:hypothetical protein
LEKECSFKIVSTNVNPGDLLGWQMGRLFMKCLNFPFVCQCQLDMHIEKQALCNAMMPFVGLAI